MVPPNHPAGISETMLTTNRREWLLGFGVVLVISIGYMWMFIDRGWIPHDEGTLAQSAERVLAGEVAHRDFVHGYTGGLNYIHAVAFKIFGVSLLAMRYALMSAFVAWVVVFYYAATRLTSVAGAVVVTLAAVFWSVPNYPAPMPSWYNLFLATAGLGALLEYITTGRRRWVLLAGLAGGLSVLMKLHGLLFIAAGLLFIIQRMTRLTRTPAACWSGWPSSRSWRSQFWP
jgi:4-amino-4-deoxy-L-arabinose transferase-like glycosyltransferase